MIQSYAAFELSVYSKGYEKRAPSSTPSEDVEPREEGNEGSEGISSHRDGPMAETVANAVATGMKENAMKFNILKEAVSR